MPFDPQPVLPGALVTARPLRADDADALYSVARDPLLWAQHPNPDRHRPEVFAAFFAESLASGGALTVTTTSGEVIGSSRYHGYDEQHGEVEIGWTFLSRAYWGGAANGELKALMLAHAFRFVERVIFLVGPGNLRSQRALAKIGAVGNGTRPDGAGRDCLLFEVRRDAWTAP